MTSLAPNHPHAQHAHGEHAPTPESLLARAQALCAERGARLTPMRENVLEILAGSAQPLGAYDLIERVAEASGRTPAPITIYRALDFLLGQGLVHRIESRSAFMACDHTHEEADVVVFLLCERCGNAIEASGADIRARLVKLAGEAGFEARGQVIEIAGECAACRSARR